MGLAARLAVVSWQAPAALVPLRSRRPDARAGSCRSPRRAETQTCRVRTRGRHACADWGVHRRTLHAAVDRKRLKDLQFITPQSNLPSILADGIFSNRRAKRIRHASVSMAEVQERREIKKVPGGLPLHQYANLYLNARNPMLYKRLSQHCQLAIISVSAKALDISNTVVTDGNAASDYSRFAAAPGGLAIVDEELTFARRWDHPDFYEYLRRKRAMCAEVLVPESVPPGLIRGVYVSCDEALESCEALGLPFKYKVNKYLYFRGDPG